MRLAGRGQDLRVIRGDELIDKVSRRFRRSNKGGPTIVGIIKSPHQELIPDEGFLRWQAERADLD
jgi:hypothetical protein